MTNMDSKEEIEKFISNKSDIYEDYVVSYSGIPHYTIMELIIIYKYTMKFIVLKWLLRISIFSHIKTYFNKTEWKYR